MDKTTDIIKVAVTGGAGSGKSFVCDRLRTLGLEVVSADTIARETVAKKAPAYNKIVEFFGKKILLHDGSLNRQMLRRIIVDDEDKRLALEKIIHPEITKKMMRKIALAKQAGGAVVVVEVPLLFELGIQDKFDVIVVISAEQKLRIQRLMNRDNVSQDEAKKLVKAQMPDQSKVERAHFVLTNNGSKKELTTAVDILYRNILKIDKKI
jgi:dephospho-CoA kinase